MAGNTIAFIGFGEAAQAFVKGWRSEGWDLPILAYDLLLDDRARAPAKQAECGALGVQAMTSAPDAAAAADIVISAVTADQVIEAASSILPAVKPGLFFLDINSAAPFRKRAAAEPVAARQAQVVDVAVMSPVHPKLHKTPLLLSGPGAAAIAPFLSDLQMNIEVVSDQLGDASTVKMVRSIAIKGFESVITECVVAAVELGVADRVLPTIGFAHDWKTKDDPVWGPIFGAYGPIRDWIEAKQPDVFLVVYNDHITSFFFDHYSAFALGIGTEYHVADEGGGARDLPPVAGHAKLAQHIGSSLVADEFDMSFFQERPLDYGNGAAIFTRDGDAARDFAARINIGMVGVNVPVPVPLAYHSFGGWKASAFGDLNQHGTDAIRFWTRTKTVTARWPSGIKDGAEFQMPTMA